MRIRRSSLRSGIGLSPALRCLSAVGARRPNSLFFSGDLGRRIFQQRFSWKALGVDVRGRLSTLRINYRTSHQIRTHADRRLGPEVSDVDGNKEDREGTVSLFNGPRPDVLVLDTQDHEILAVSQWYCRGATRGSCRTKSACAFALRPRWIALARQSVARSSHSRARRQRGEDPWPGVDQHHAPRQGPRVFTRSW